jgi:hypothetical protein
LTVGESPKDKLLVGTVDGIFSFRQRNGAWEHEGTLVSGKHISSIIFEPSSRTLFAGTYSGEIFAGTELDGRWERRDDGVGGREIYSLASQSLAHGPRRCAKCRALNNGHFRRRRIRPT